MKQYLDLLKRVLIDGYTIELSQLKKDVDHDGSTSEKFTFWISKKAEK